jgi:uncharacterized RDD family membrane protein YckC
METPPPPERPEPDQPPSPGEPPPPPGGPRAPAGPQAPPPPAGPQAPAYGGPVPPGGWEQPLPPAAPGWHGRPLASWGSRVAAQLLDFLILLVPVVVLTAVVVAIATNSGTAAWVIAVLGFLAYIVVLLLYAPLLMAREGRSNGQSWGKQILGIRVIRDNGEAMSFGQAALREIVVKNLCVGIASTVIPLIPWFLDNFWPLWDDENRALHDMAVSTHVVRG